MLKRLFTSTTRIKILLLLLFNQDQEYHLREIGRSINASPRYVSKEMGNLQKINLVRMQKKGTMHLYSINKNSIILPELRLLFLKTDYLGTFIKERLTGKVTY